MKSRSSSAAARVQFEASYQVGRTEFGKFCEQIGSAPTRQAKVRALLSGLQWAKSPPIGELSDAGSSDEDDPLSDARNRYIIALRFIAVFIKHCDSADIGEWIEDLASELTDLENGAGSKLLGQQPGRADSTSIWRPRSYVAVGVDLLIEHGTSLKAVTDRLDGKAFNKEFPNLTRLLRRTAIRKSDEMLHLVTLGNSALSWRKELKEGRCKNIEARAIWDYLRCAEDGLPPVEYADRLFRIADTV